MNGQLARRHFFIPSAGYARGFKGEGRELLYAKKITALRICITLCRHRAADGLR
jgi:hypothetical protein